MNPQTILQLLPLLVLLVWAAYEDCRVRKIRNWLTLSLALSGLMQPAMGGVGISFGSAVLGFLAGFGLMLGFFVIGAVGGGDVKLLAAIGAWVGPWGITQIFLTEAVVGAVLVIYQSARQGRLAVLTRNSAVIALTLIHIRQVGFESATEIGKSTRTVGRPLPFAVPILIAVLVLMIAGRLPVR